MLIWCGGLAKASWSRHKSLGQLPQSFWAGNTCPRYTGLAQKGERFLASLKPASRHPSSSVTLGRLRLLWRSSSTLFWQTVNFSHIWGETRRGLVAPRGAAAAAGPGVRAVPTSSCSWAARACRSRASRRLSGSAARRAAASSSSASPEESAPGSGAAAALGTSGSSSSSSGGGSSAEPRAGGRRRPARARAQPQSRGNFMVRLLLGSGPGPFSSARLAGWMSSGHPWTCIYRGGFEIIHGLGKSGMRTRGVCAHGARPALTALLESRDCETGRGGAAESGRWEHEVIVLRNSLRAGLPPAPTHLPRGDPAGAAAPRSGCLRACRLQPHKTPGNHTDTPTYTHTYFIYAICFRVF